MEHFVEPKNKGLSKPQYIPIDNTGSPLEIDTKPKASKKESQVKRRKTPVAQETPGAQEISVVQKIPVEKEIPLGFTYAQSTLSNPLPAILLVMLISPYINRYETSSELEASIEKNLDELDTVLDILSSIHPYLDYEYQDGINFVFGLMEAKSILKKLMNKTYRASRTQDSKNYPLTYQERAIGIIKSLQPYISLENQGHVNRILDINNVVGELTRRIKKFEQESLDAKDPGTYNIDKLIEIIDIIKIVVPKEQQQNIRQISNMLRVVKTAELMQLLNTSKKSSSKPADVDYGQAQLPEENKSLTLESNESKKNHKKDSDELGESKHKTNRAEKEEKLKKSLESVMGPEQAKSLDMIMKVVELLSADGGS